MGRSMWLAPVWLLPVGCTDAGDDSAAEESDTDTDTDTDADTDADTDTDTDTDTDVAATAWSGDYELPADALALRADRDGDFVGMSLGAGDFDGDGATDVVAPALFRSSGGELGVGQVAIALGPITADVDLGTAWVTIEGELGESAFFGEAVAALPDGGQDALVVSAPGSWEGGANHDAAVYLFRDLTGGALDPAEADVIWTGEDARNELGLSMVVADFDANGTADVLLGAPLEMTTHFYDGVVYGISGDALDTQPEDAQLRIYGASDSYSTYLGAVMTNLGDVDDDGNDDLAIYGTGAVSIFHGPLEGAMLSSDADTTVEVAWARTPPGSLASAGDVDGDGTVDLLIGNPFEQPDSAYDPGAVWLINGTHLDKGSTPIVLADWKIEGFSQYQNVGYQAASAGDIDGDGHADILVSAPGDAEYGSNSGDVLFFQGPLSGTAEPDEGEAAFHGDANAYVGRALLPAIDVTGDGPRDIVVGAPNLGGYGDGGESAVFIVPGLGI